jgi:hypothetical protein
LDTPRGAWAALLLAALLAVFALGSAIPHRPVAVAGTGPDAYAAEKSTAV